MPSNSLIKSYLFRHGVPEAARSDGRATIIVDDKYRVHLADTRLGCLAITARLCLLPPRGAARDEFFITLGYNASAMLSKHPSTCVVDLAGEALWLQQILRPEVDALGIDEAVGEFVNALSFWSAFYSAPPDEGPLL